MRPSVVRSKSAPQASSSRTRSGASFAWSCAIRQLFTYCPPRTVSAKCTFQLSRSSTLARAAATPPSAMTVCAFPSSDLQTIPTLAPAADAAIAARSPAPPAPMTRTSCSKVWYSDISRDSGLVTLSQNPHIVPHSHRTHPDVQVRERDREETGPGPPHVRQIEAAGALIQPPPQWSPGQPVQVTTDHVAQRMTTERVAAQEDHIHREEESSDPDAERRLTGGRITEPERLIDVRRQHQKEKQGDVQEVAVDVLQDEGKGRLAAV